jgi:hypothetical protein
MKRTSAIVVSMEKALIVRPVTDSDLPAWSTLWDGYNVFYGRKDATALADEITQTTWKRFFDPHEPVHALVAEQDGRLLGLTHFLFHRSTTQLVHRRSGARKGRRPRADRSCLSSRHGSRFTARVLANPRNQPYRQAPLRSDRQALGFSCIQPRGLIGLATDQATSIAALARRSSLSRCWPTRR